MVKQMVKQMNNNSSPGACPKIDVYQCVTLLSEPPSIYDDSILTGVLLFSDLAM